MPQDHAVNHTETFRKEPEHDLLLLNPRAPFSFIYPPSPPEMLKSSNGPGSRGSVTGLSSGILDGEPQRRESGAATDVLRPNLPGWDARRVGTQSRRPGCGRTTQPAERALSFGRELQEERVKRGISLDSVAEATKVASRYLHALEEGDHASLPGGVFNKGIVRAYCRHLGLNEEEWLQRFSTFARSEGNDNWAEFAENVKRNRVQMTPQMRIRWWGVLLMLIGLAMAGWAVWHYLVKPRLHTSATPVVGFVLPARPNQG